MKKIAFAVAAIMLLGAPEANAQGFLSKLKDKAASAVAGQLMGKKDKASVKEASSEEESSDDEESASQDVMQGVMTPEQQLQRRRISSFTWDEKITPSSSTSPTALMAEFPAVPSAAELANPSEKGMISFYNGIKRVTLRAQELNLDTTCEDEFVLQWRMKKEKEIADALGLTRAEMDLLNSENITDEQREKIEEKVKMKLLGGVDAEALQAKAEAGQLTAADMANLRNLAKNVQTMQDKLAVNETSRALIKLSKATKTMQESISAGANVDAKFSAAERKKVQALKDKIYATDDPAVYNPLFAQAYESIRTYRVRAAEIWSAAVQKHVNDIKAKLPAYIKAQEQAVQDGILPDCGVNRAPLNVVIEVGDILEDAYSEFPCNYPPMYKEEILDEQYNIWWPESYVCSSIDDILAKNYLFKYDANGNLCEVKNGRLVKVGEDFYKKTLPTMKQPESAVWKSADGKREVIYNAKGQWLQLPEGDVVYPVAIKKSGNEIIWIIYQAVEANKTMRTYKNEDGEVVEVRNGIRVIKCTYKI